MRQRVVFSVETVGGGVRTHVLQLLKNLDPERYELTLIYGERYDHVFESQREELAKHVTLILDSNLVRSAGLRASWKAVKSLRATLRRIKPDISLLVAGTGMAYTPLMKQLESHPHFTVAQFAQAIGAVYYANS